MMFYHLLAHLLTYIPSDLLTYILYFIVSHRPESIFIFFIKKEEKGFHDENKVKGIIQCENINGTLLNNISISVLFHLNQ